MRKHYKYDHVCKIKGCGDIVFVVGFCRTHYMNKHRYGDPLETGPKKESKRTCIIEGCHYKRLSLDFCEGHYELWKANYRFVKKSIALHYMNQNFTELGG